jgi:hypothetical protein
MATSALTRQKYLYNGVTVTYPPLMTDDELALVLEVFVEEVRDRPLKKRPAGHIQQPRITRKA